MHQPLPPDATFGSSLRAMREVAGLTQEELAERAGLTSHAISALERGARTRPYPHTVRALATALGAPPDQAAALQALVPRRGSARSDTTTERDGAAAAGRSSSLPVPATPLLGRAGDVSEVSSLLLDPQHRLVTLTGTGGVGKTRLTVAVAEQVADKFADGVAFVALAPVADPALVVPAIGRATGCPDAESSDPVATVVEHLAGARTLLVLDNLEHLLDAAPQVAEVVAACPNVVVLASSRAALGVRGEVEYPVQPLAVPAGQRVSGAAVSDSAAGSLFEARARAVAPAFAVTDDNAAAVAAICRRLAGIPLALEIAAARIRVLDPASLLTRLGAALDSAGARDLPARQRTMRSTLDWSYQLLEPGEQALFRRLGVFVGGFTLEAAEAVGEGDVVELLDRLAGQSLVVVRHSAAGTRYELLEPIADYARDVLAGAAESEAAELAHACYFLDLAERAAVGYTVADQLEWLARVEADDPNMVAALQRALGRGDAALAGRLGWALWLYWWLRGHQLLGRRLMEEALTHDLPDDVRARTLCTAAAMAFAQGDHGMSAVRWRQAYELSVSCGDDYLAAHSLPGVGLAALVHGDVVTAEDTFRRTLPRAAAFGEAGGWISALTHSWLGTVRLLQGDTAEASEQLHLGLTLARSRGDRLAGYVALFNLSQVAISTGDRVQARAHLVQGIRLSEETRDLANLAYFLDALAVVEGEEGDATRVATLLGAATGLREVVGSSVYGYYQPDEALRDAAADRARDELGGSAYDEAFEAGREMRFADLVDYAAP